MSKCFLEKRNDQEKCVHLDILFGPSVRLVVVDHVTLI